MTEKETRATSLETTLIQLYRGEVGRSDRWRMRLDTTTNWALTTTAAVISLAFSSPHSHPFIIVIGLWMVLTFLYIETRRYRYYDLWNRRVRLLEEGVWAPMLRNEPFDADALRELASELERPHLQLSLLSAMQTRLSRAYGSLFSVLMLSWLAKLTLHPTPTGHMHEIADRASIGPIPGWLAISVLSFSTLFFFVLYLIGRWGRQPAGELQPRPTRLTRSLWDVFLGSKRS